ncbi:MAG: hypothetical protein QXT43_01610 [Candidatus Micrarchaeaceae archaeon]
MAQEQRKFDGYLAEIVDVLDKTTGMFGSVKQAMCKIIEGPDKGRVIRRNIVGYVKKGDIIRLSDTTREDRPISVR